MQGMSMSSLKKHKALIPLYVCVGIGCVMAVGYTARLAFRNPDVAWNRRPDQISNEEYREKQYKFYSPNIDYKNLEKAPKI
ncbi:nadh-ubiquinone oxidoreductase mlrq subunit [Holotrichia oblita]|uniref:Nadh-ubiquinone oxidoreductase mlrq subunit n=2 Tax=Holotrichia oblita TaxID=644536 RepID=A0ACB9SXJ0_HOLOL|nr:nadh-ubiquinone oxidoreductase mlrq subunit [Holotrichia oblita]KAI4459306.1 nadh-ubiquinone oxidoreductase mlrq subunit [Holotrichia oblita]